MTVLSIEGLRLTTRIGATDEERATPQVVIVDVKVDADLRAAEDGDELDATIDYDSLCRDVAALVERSDCRLLEHLAAQIAERITADPRVVTVTVDVAKESPPVKQEVGRIAVQVQRARRP